jgi:hypothetical protein
MSLSTSRRLIQTIPPFAECCPQKEKACEPNLFAVQHPAGFMFTYNIDGVLRNVKG